ncbi:hypothetical protein [Methylobacterium amylolyticum]|uniref:hypothetical protein n=1 Tax=Methylobacterium sp. NEAU 140 TaxID=3064945 RepID=UPI0027353880|nr:hypothetical protein [Methylobacterium sp. NEAU 140]
MAMWISGLAVFGLLCLMILPAPGIWGVLIGGVCILTIAVSAVLFVLDRAATGALGWVERVRARRRRHGRRRAIHAGSGIARKL